MSNDITIPGDEAYLSFGGWAKPMANPPKMHERRRYIIDVECTDAGVGASGKGERSRRKLSILRVAEVTGVVVPPKSKTEDDDDDAPPMFNADGSIPDDPQTLGDVINQASQAAAREASADEGDEIRAKREEDKAAGDGEGADETSNDEGDGEEVDPNDPAADPWPGDADADGDDPAAGDVEVVDEPGEWESPAADNVAPMFRAAGDE